MNGIKAIRHKCQVNDQCCIASHSQIKDKQMAKAKEKPDIFHKHTWGAAKLSLALVPILLQPPVVNKESFRTKYLYPKQILEQHLVEWFELQL